MNSFFTLRDACPSCGGEDAVELRRHSYDTPEILTYLKSFYQSQGNPELQFLSEQDYVLTECLGCKLVFQSEIPGDELMYSLYEVWIDPEKCFTNHETNRSVDYFASRFAEIARILTFLDRPLRELDILDYSMGWGNWCRIAAAFGCNVHGTEFSPSRIAHARRNGVTVVTHEEMVENRYDYINTDQVFEHVPDPFPTLMRLKSCLKPNGLIKLSVPNGWDIKRRLEVWDWAAPKGSEKSLNAVAPLEHINCFNENSLTRLAERAGLVPVFIPAKIEENVQRRRVTLRSQLRRITTPIVRMIRNDRPGDHVGKGSTHLFFCCPKE